MMFQYVRDGKLLSYWDYPRRTTERRVELAIADYWWELQTWDTPLTEIGCCTPYWWETTYQERIGKIIDPFDNRATDQVSVFDHTYDDEYVLSISSLHHVNSGSYGEPTNNKTPLEAYQHVQVSCKRSLITVPYGHKAGKGLQEYLVNVALGIEKGVGEQVFILSRVGDSSYWVPSTKTRDYSSAEGRANTVLIAEYARSLGLVL